MLGQLRTAGLYPAVDAPNFTIDGAPQYGGVVVAGSEFVIGDPNAAGGQIYYTLDGTDPRISGASTAVTLLIDESVHNPGVRVLVDELGFKPAEKG